MYVTVFVVNLKPLTTIYAINLSYEDTLKKLRDVDKKRKKYYESLNKESIWGSKNDYDLLIDSGSIGIENVIDILENIYRMKNK